MVHADNVPAHHPRLLGERVQHGESGRVANATGGSGGLFNDAFRLKKSYNSIKHGSMIVIVNLEAGICLKTSGNRSRSSPSRLPFSLCVAGAVILRPNQRSFFYGRRVFWFLLLNQPDVGCGSLKLRRRGRDHPGGEKCYTGLQT